MAQVNVTLKDAKMPKVHMVQHTHPNDMRFAFWSCLRKVLTTRWIILYSSSTRQLPLNQNWGFAGVDVSWIWKIQLICVKSKYFLPMLHLQTCWTTEWERWHLWHFMIFGPCLIYGFQHIILKCRCPFRSKLRSKRYKKVHPRTNGIQKKNIYKTYHQFFWVPSGGLFPIPIPSPYPWTWQSLQGLDMDASLRLRAASPTQVGLNNLGIRWREEKVKQRRLGS